MTPVGHAGAEIFIFLDTTPTAARWNAGSGDAVGALVATQWVLHGTRPIAFESAKPPNILHQYPDRPPWSCPVVRSTIGNQP